MSYLILSITAALISIIINIAQGNEISRQETRIKSYKQRIHRMDRLLALGSDGRLEPEWAFAGRINGLSPAEEETM